MISYGACLMKSKSAIDKAKNRDVMRSKGFVPKQIWAKPACWNKNFAEIKRLAGHESK